MKNVHIIRSLGPNLIQDHSLRHHSGFVGTLSHSLMFWMALLGLLLWIGFGVAHGQSQGSDPMVMKIYPDGTRVIVRWSEIGKAVAADSMAHVASRVRMPAIEHEIL